MFTVAVAHGIDTHWRTPGNDSARNTDTSERGTRPDDVRKEDDQLSSREQGDRPSASDDGSDAGKSSPYRTMPSTSHTQKRPPPSQHFWATPGPIRIGGNRLVEHFLRTVCSAARELRWFLSGTDACREMCTTSAKARLACRQNAAGKWAWCCQRTMLTSIMLLLSCISARLQAIETRPRQIQIRMTMRR